MKLDIVIVDDERPAIDELEELLQESPQIGSITTHMKARDALEDIMARKPHVVFLDIQMPGMDGLQMAERLQAEIPQTQVVFVTAYGQHALKAFELAAVDYLLKPVDPARLAMTVDRLHRRIGSGAVGSEEADRPVAEAAPPVIRAFGRLSVHTPDGRKVRWKTVKVEEMFAYLLLHRTISTEKIIHDLFPESEAERAKPYIHTCIYQIRKGLTAVSLSDRIKIQYDRGLYKLDTGQADCDLERLEGAFTPSSGSPAEGEERIQLIVSLYTGELFEGIDNLWITEKREYYRRKSIRQALSLLDQPGTAIGPAKAAEYLEALHKLDTLNESIALRLAGLYRDMGRISAARDFLEQFQSAYRSELGLELPEPLTGLYRSLRQ